MGNIDRVLDLAAADPDLRRRLADDFVGAASAEGIDITPAEAKEYLAVPETSDVDWVEALQQRVAAVTPFTDGPGGGCYT